MSGLSVFERKTKRLIGSRARSKRGLARVQDRNKFKQGQLAGVVLLEQAEREAYRMHSLWRKEQSGNKNRENGLSREITSTAEYFEQAESETGVT